MNTVLAEKKQEGSLGGAVSDCLSMSIITVTETVRAILSRLCQDLSRTGDL